MQVFLIKGKPMIESSENRIAIFNEIMATLYLLLAMSLSGLQSPNPVQAQCGMALIGIILFTFAVNLAKFLIVFIIKTVRVVRRRR
jgi:hypothetical protein